MSPHDFLSKLEQSGLVTDEAIGKLQRRIKRSPERFDREGIVKWLISHDYITTSQGKRLLEQTAEPAPAQAPPSAADELDEFGLAPLDDEPPVAPSAAPQSPKQPAPVDESDPFGLAPLDEEADAPQSPPAKKQRELAPSLSPAADLNDMGLPPEPELERKPSKKRRSSGRSSSTWRDEDPPPSPPRKSKRGPLDDLAPEAEDEWVEPEAVDEKSPLAGSGAGKKSKSKERKKSIWDSPLLLVGGGLLLLLIFAAAGMALWISRDAANRAFAAAEADYEVGSYGAAITKYNAFIEAYPRHEKVGLAKVRRGMAQLWETVNRSTDWPASLAAAENTLEALSGMEEFPQAHRDLGTIIPRIADGLIQAAEAQQEMRLVGDAVKALDLLNTYSIPYDVVPTEQVTRTRATIETTRRFLARQSELNVTVEKIEEAVTDGDLSRAYVLRSSLLKTYPDLVRDDSLRAAIQKVVDAERARVKVDETTRPAMTDDVERSTESVALVKSPEGGAAPSHDMIYYASAGGTIYAVDSRDGKVIWDRAIGLDGPIHPQQVPDSSGDLILVDSTRSELLRVDGVTGELRWRQSFEGGMQAPPTVLSDRILISSMNGRIDQFNIADGELVRSIVLPTELTCGATIDSQRRVYYQPGLHSNLYILSAVNGECVDVFYLEHGAQSITVAPLAVNRYVFVAENRGASDAVLHILVSDEEGKNLTRVDRIPLSGHVHTPMLISGRILVIATDTGALYSFEVTPPGGDRALVPIAQKPSETGEPLVRYPVLDRGQLWVAGRDLTRYRLQTAGGRMAGESVKFAGDVFLQPPRVFGETLVTARRKPGSTTVFVAGTHTSDDRPLWEIELGTPLSGHLIPSKDNALLALNRNGSLYRIPLDPTAESAILRRPIADADGPAGHVSNSLATVTSSGIAVFADVAQPRRAWVLDTREASPRLTPLELPDELTGPPAEVGEGLLAPGRLGQIYLIDPHTGRQLAYPFQPRLTSAGPHKWTGAASVDNGVVIADADRLYRLAVSTGTEPALVEEASVALPAPLVADPCVLNGHVLGVGADQKLHVYRLPNLEVVGETPLSARVIWGPQVFGEHVLVAMADERLACFTADAELAWSTEFAGERIKGVATAPDGAYLAALSSGTVVKLSAADGKEINRANTGAAVSAGPTVTANHLVMVGHDGKLHFIEQF